MIIELLGNFYNNHSLSIVNRQLALQLAKLNPDFRIIALDSYDPEYNLDKNTVKQLKDLEADTTEPADVQLRHTYPPIWQWPESEKTKVVYIQPWEYEKVPFEWQYKFETFADGVIVPSNYCRSIFLKGGINPAKITTIPNGYDSSIFNLNTGNCVKHLGIDAGKFNFIFVGNIQWRKGLDILLNTWSKTFSKADNARLIIKDNSAVYGKSNLLNEIVKLEYKTNCAPIIYVDKQLSDTEMSDMYKASKVVVHPYRAEGFGMHIQEAVACGCLPIVSANGPTDDFIPADVGFKINTIKKPIDITSKQIFAAKPGDAMTGMGSHTFSNEPIASELQQLLSYAYHSHDLAAMYDKIHKIKTLNTWETVAKQYIAVADQISQVTINRKG